MRLKNDTAQIADSICNLFRLLKKGQGKNSAQIIIGLIVFSLVFAAIGFYFPAFKIFA